MPRILHITDTHLPGKEAPGLHDVPVWKLLDRLLELVGNMPEKPDLLLHTGDLAENGEVEAYEKFHARVSALGVPYLVLNGNHDSPEALASSLGMPSVSHADKQFSIDFVHEVDGFPIVGLDTWHPEQRNPLGRITDGQLDWLAGMLDRLATPALVCMHHAPFPLGSPWLDENMVTSGADALHAVLRSRADRVRAVLHGHLHRGVHIVRDRVAYHGLGALGWQYTWLPWTLSPTLDADAAAVWQLIELASDRVQLMEHSLPPLENHRS